VSRLDELELVGSDVEGIDIGGEASVGLLGAVGADQGVDLDGVNVVQSLEGLLDLGLVGLDVDNEDESVVLLHLLHRALSVERVDDDLVLIETRKVRDRLAGVLGRAGQLQGLGTVEAVAQADLAGLLAVGTLEGSLGGRVGLLGRVGGCRVKSISNRSSSENSQSLLLHDA
jgi:hypothetical protein